MNLPPGCQIFATKTAKHKKVNKKCSSNQRVVSYTLLQHNPSIFLKKMSSFEEINVAREKLMDALGDNAKQYIQQMKLWFQMKSTKEDFDLEARKLLDPSHTHLHNQFLLQLFLKCSKQDFNLTSPPLTNQRIKTKRRIRQHNNGFQAANVHDYVEERAPPRPQEEPIRYSAQELFLPDCELIHMRLMLAAWELGLKGAEQNAAEILVIAVQHFLKNILSATLSRRNGFRIREKTIQYAVGMPVPNPWLRNIALYRNNKVDGPVLEMLECGESVPGERLLATDVQQDIAMSYAAAPDKPPKRPVSAAECFEALQIYRGMVPSNGVYSTNMERLSIQIQHPGWDDFGE